MIKLIHNCIEHIPYENRWYLTFRWYLTLVNLKIIWLLKTSLLRNLDIYYDNIHPFQILTKFQTYVYKVNINESKSEKYSPRIFTK